MTDRNLSQEQSQSHATACYAARMSFAPLSARTPAAASGLAPAECSVVWSLASSLDATAYFHKYLPQAR